MMSKRILIVEDEPNITVSLSFLLEREGFEVMSETDGGKALDSIATLKPDLVILDVMLPNKSGFDIARELRQANQIDSTRILMLTAKGQAKDRQAAEDAGVDKFMTKPFSNRDVISTVHELTA
jgi:DNA-binding response OmpR family regulator